MQQSTPWLYNIYQIQNIFPKYPYRLQYLSGSYLSSPPLIAQKQFLSQIYQPWNTSLKQKKEKLNSPDNTYKLSTSLRPIKIKNTRSQKHLKNLPPLLPKSPPSNSPSPVTKYIPRISQQVPSYLLQPNLQPWSHLGILFSSPHPNTPLNGDLSLCWKTLSPYIPPTPQTTLDTSRDPPRKRSI